MAVPHKQSNGTTSSKSRSSKKPPSDAGAPASDAASAATTKRVHHQTKQNRSATSVHSHSHSAHSHSHSAHSQAADAAHASLAIAPQHPPPDAYAGSSVAAGLLLIGCLVYLTFEKKAGRSKLSSSGGVAASPATPRVAHQYLLAVACAGLSTLQSLLVEISKGGATAAQPPAAPAYDAPSLVFFTELLKLTVALALSLPPPRDLSPSRVREAMRLRAPYLYAVPAAIYVVQGHLFYLATRLLDPPTFQLWSCFKLIPAALAAHCLLDQRRSKLQWTALLLVCLGMGVATVRPDGSGGGGGAADASAASRLKGITVVVGTGCLAALSGVANEWLLKSTDTSVPLMLKNAYLYAFSTSIALLTLLLRGRPPTLSGWGALLVACGALTGLTVSAVLKYLDNVIKGLLSSLALLLASLLSAAFLSFVLTTHFALGTLVVISAFYIYFGRHAEEVASRRPG